MDALIRRRALLAAAKVALSMSVFGCAAAVDQPPADENANAESDELRRHHVDAGHTSCHDAGAPTAPKTKAECKAYVDAHEADAGGGWADLPPGSAKRDPELAACCTTLIDGGFNSDTYQEVSACCQDMGDTKDLACTPWGPPAPPAVDEAAIAMFHARRAASQEAA
jgi:hypothetical protein